MSCYNVLSVTGELAFGAGVFYLIVFSFMSFQIVFSVGFEGTLFTIKGCILMLTFYMSCKGLLFFKAPEAPQTTPGHVIALKVYNILINLRKAPLFITSTLEPPHGNLRTGTSALEPPHGNLRTGTSALEPL